MIGNSHSKTSLAAENSAQPDHANAVRAAEGGGLSSGWSTARNSGHGDIHDDSSSIFAGRRQSQHVAAQPVDSTQQQQQQQYDEADEAAFEQIKAKVSSAWSDTCHVLSRLLGRASSDKVGADPC